MKHRSERVSGNFSPDNIANYKTLSRRFFADYGTLASSVKKFYKSKFKKWNVSRETFHFLIINTILYLHYTIFNCIHCSLCSVCNSNFLKDTGYMIFNCFFTDKEFLTNFSVIHSFSQQFKNLNFSLC